MNIRWSNIITNAELLRINKKKSLEKSKNANGENLQNRRQKVMDNNGDYIID